ncbi:hypothetical protein [Nonomuraea solani]|uniref:hypothetical protein n=1 Tax=Nonomuraea solani TaxID=1144553 RepID=UPI00190E6666|nr:hypothetical protein [Nonomuraea solani]
MTAPSANSWTRPRRSAPANPFDLPDFCHYGVGTIGGHTPIAAVISDFYRTFQRRSRQAPYPLEEIRRLGME